MLILLHADKYGWQTCIALWVMCIAMTCTLRYIDVRYLLPKRLAFAEAVNTGEIAVAGHVVTKGDVDGGVAIVDDDGTDMDKGAKVKSGPVST